MTPYELRNFLLFYRMERIDTYAILEDGSAILHSSLPTLGYGAGAFRKSITLSPIYENRPYIKDANIRTFERFTESEDLIYDDRIILATTIPNVVIKEENFLELLYAFKSHYNSAITNWYTKVLQNFVDTSAGIAIGWDMFSYHLPYQKSVFSEDYFSLFDPSSYIDIMADINYI